jgi:hypothetical protein
MTDPIDTAAAATTYLEMSDAEVMASAPPAGSPLVPAEAAAVPDGVSDVAVPDEADLAADDKGTDQVPDGDADSLVIDTKQLSSDLSDSKSAADEADTTDKTPPETPVVDFEAEYKRLLTPFKANGHDITINSVDDAIQLMQMGANYNKKMAALKPNLKLMKTLENNGLLEEGKISYLIDLVNKNPEAINKLVKESGINPMDLDAEKAGDYKPKIHTVDDREMELDTVLDNISSTPSYNRTLNIVSTEWDGASKQVLAESPQLLAVINDHVQRGIYDVISKEVDRERMFDRLNGLSDIAAYRKVGDAIQARGGFDHLGSPQKTPTKAGLVVVPKPKVDDDALKDKRRAASSTKPAVSTTQTKDFNPLSLSDADFGKLVNPKYV